VFLAMQEMKKRKKEIILKEKNSKYKGKFNLITIFNDIKQNSNINFQ